MTYGREYYEKQSASPRSAVRRRRRPDSDPDYPPVDVAIVCESTYPFLTGGLSAVVHQICEANSEITIGIIHIAWDSTSPTEPLYEVPSNVLWVKTVYQSLSEHSHSFQRFTPRDTKLSSRKTGVLAREVIDAIRQHMQSDDSGLWRIYDEGINPLTRRYRVWPVLTTKEFMVEANAYFGTSGLSFTELFWTLREFFSLAYAATDVVYPRATVYHAHTTGAAAVLAAVAARQHSGAFLLTEHNLYARDTINHLLHRSMDTIVTAEEWRTLDAYPSAESLPQTLHVTERQRAWMAWWVRTGIFAYRAADQITYLYPDAIDEARLLGGLPEKSIVFPNGVDRSHFDEARALFESRQEAARNRGGERHWKLAYAARVVPIKGLLDLLEALAILKQRGVVNWHLDVMGPDGEMPDYVEQCHQRCTELGLDDDVNWLGSVDLRKMFGHYDTLILPSHNEGQPIVVLEAMTMGLPTVGTYVGGMKQLVEDELTVVTEDGLSVTLGPCGALVDSHDIDGLANAIDTVISSPAAFDEFSLNAKLRVDHYFHIDAAMEHYRGKYAELLNRYTGRGEIAPSAPVTVAAEGATVHWGREPVLPEFADSLEPVE